MSFWQSFRREEIIIIMLCVAALTFCAGAEWGRRRQKLPSLFHDPPQTNFSRCPRPHHPFHMNFSLRVPLFFFVLTSVVASADEAPPDNATPPIVTQVETAATAPPPP